MCESVCVFVCVREFVCVCAHMCVCVCESVCAHVCVCACVCPSLKVTAERLSADTGEVERQICWMRRFRKFSM